MGITTLMLSLPYSEGGNHVTSESPRSPLQGLCVLLSYLARTHSSSVLCQDVKRFKNTFVEHLIPYIQAIWATTSPIVIGTREPWPSCRRARPIQGWRLPSDFPGWYVLLRSIHILRKLGYGQYSTVSLAKDSKYYYMLPSLSYTS